MSHLDPDQARREAVLTVRTLTLAIDEYRRVVTELFDINVTDLMALGHLFNAQGTDGSGGLGQTELANLLGRTTSSVTSMIDRLESGGFAERHSDPDDRRRAVVRLTDRGRLTLAVVYGTLRDAVEPFTDLPGLTRELRQLSDGILAQLPLLAERKAALEAGANPRRSAAS